MGQCTKLAFLSCLKLSHKNTEAGRVAMVRFWKNTFFLQEEREPERDAGRMEFTPLNVHARFLCSQRKASFSSMYAISTMVKNTVGLI